MLRPRSQPIDWSAGFKHRGVLKRFLFVWLASAAAFHAGCQQAPDGITERTPKGEPSDRQRASSGRESDSGVHVSAPLADAGRKDGATPGDSAAESPGAGTDASTPARVSEQTESVHPLALRPVPPDTFTLPRSPALVERDPPAAPAASDATDQASGAPSSPGGESVHTVPQPDATAPDGTRDEATAPDRTPGDEVTVPDDAPVSDADSATAPDGSRPPNTVPLTLAKKINVVKLPNAAPDEGADVLWNIRPVLPVASRVRPEGLVKLDTRKSISFPEAEGVSVIVKLTRLRTRLHLRLEAEAKLGRDKMELSTTRLTALQRSLPASITEAERNLAAAKRSKSAADSRLSTLRLGGVRKSEIPEYNRMMRISKTCGRRIFTLSTKTIPRVQDRHRRLPQLAGILKALEQAPLHYELVFPKADEPVSK